MVAAVHVQVNPQGAAQSLLQRLRSLSAAAAGWLGLSAGLSQVHYSVQTRFVGYPIHHGMHHVSLQLPAGRLVGACHL